MKKVELGMDAARSPIFQPIQPNDPIDKLTIPPNKIILHNLNKETRIIILKLDFFEARLRVDSTNL